MNKNVRMKQNKISQNIRKKDKCSSLYESLGHNMIWLNRVYTENMKIALV